MSDCSEYHIYISIVELSCKCDLYRTVILWFGVKLYTAVKNKVKTYNGGSG